MMREEGFDGGNGYKYLLVMVNDVSNFAVGHCVSVARVSRKGPMSEQMSKWIGPRMIVTATQVHVYDAEQGDGFDMKVLGPGCEVRKRLKKEYDIKV